MTLYIVPIVEGHTEQGCIERLLHRVWVELLCRLTSGRGTVPWSSGLARSSDGEVLTDTLRKAFLKLRTSARETPRPGRSC